MNTEELRALQAPIKERYRTDPGSGMLTLKAEGELGAQDVVCKVSTGRGMIEAGLHPGVGGDGLAVCSGDMLLESLVACAGVTLGAVATALGLTVRGGTVAAEGDLDFRGTLAVSKDAAVGFKEIRLRFEIDSDATADQLETLLKLTERYCVIYQTLRASPALRASCGSTRGPDSTD